MGSFPGRIQAGGGPKVSPTVWVLKLCAGSDVMLRAVSDGREMCTSGAVVSNNRSVGRRSGGRLDSQVKMNSLR